MAQTGQECHKLTQHCPPPKWSKMTPKQGKWPQNGCKKFKMTPILCGKHAKKGKHGEKSWGGNIAKSAKYAQYMQNMRFLDKKKNMKYGPNMRSTHHPWVIFQLGQTRGVQMWRHRATGQKHLPLLAHTRAGVSQTAKNLARHREIKIARHKKI